jgi:hypothetical protein
MKQNKAEKAKIYVKNFTKVSYTLKCDHGAAPRQPRIESVIFFAGPSKSKTSQHDEVHISSQSLKQLPR